jgi:hypothetical protein
MVLLRHADLTDSPAEPLSWDDIALGILVICHENSGKRSVIAMPLLFFRAGASVAQDFRGN